jgi:hypothetical protein
MFGLFKRKPKQLLVVKVDIGTMPPAKAREYVEHLSVVLREQLLPDQKFLILAGDCDVFVVPLK